MKFELKLLRSGLSSKQVRDRALYYAKQGTTMMPLAGKKHSVDKLRTYTVPRMALVESFLRNWEESREAWYRPLIGVHDIIDAYETPLNLVLLIKGKGCYRMVKVKSKSRKRLKKGTITVWGRF